MGNKWNVVFATISECQAFVACDGRCDPSSKIIYVRKYLNDEEPTFDGISIGYDDRPKMQNKTLRHEIVHAFMWESGLWRNARALNGDSWSMNEEMVDWIAIQFPKIQKVYVQLGIEEQRRESYD